MEEIISQLPKSRVKIVSKNKTSHVLVNGNSLKLMKNMPEESIHLIITDPPYNIGLDYGDEYNDNKSKKEYYRWCEEWLTECARILHKEGSFYLISYPEINARLLPFIEDNLKLNFQRWITWHYPTNIGHSNKNYTRSHRSILFFTKSRKYVFNREKVLQAYKNPEVGKIKDKIREGSIGRAAYDYLENKDVLEMQELEKLQERYYDIQKINLLKNVSKDRVGSLKKGDKDHHPCQLPLPLLERLVKVSSKEKQILFDPFAGTFTLAKIASDLERNSIGIEQNRYFVKLGRERLE